MVTPHHGPTMHFAQVGLEVLVEGPSGTTSHTLAFHRVYGSFYSGPLLVTDYVTAPNI